MWTYEDIVLRNPAQPGQRSSILDRLLRTGVAFPDLLVDGANDLETYGSPFVCCFAQLPFPIAMQPYVYVLRATAEIIFHVRFQLIGLELDEDCQPHVKSFTATKSSQSQELAIGTQVTAFVQLWRRYVSLHKSYEACLTPNGLEDRVINPSVWTKKNSPVSSGHSTTAYGFEAELAERIERDLDIALSNMLLHLSVLGLEDFTRMPCLYGYFLMPAPGRVVYANRPIPVFKGMLKTSLIPQLTKKDELNSAMQFQVRHISGFLAELITLKEVSKLGESHLAIAGASAQIEKYLNGFVKDKLDGHSRAIWRCLQEEPFNTLPDDLKERLQIIGCMRNEIMHGVRKGDKRCEVLLKKKLGPEEVIATGLSLYKELHLRKIDRDGRPD